MLHPKESEQVEKNSTFCTQWRWNTETALCEQIAVAPP